MRKDILDKAVKFGAGRYRQERNLLAESGEEIRRFGKRVYIIAGFKAFAAVKESLLPSLMRAQVEYITMIYEGECSYEAAADIGKDCLNHGCDEVVGIGGGKIMDFAKAVAETVGLGVVNIPTSIATCAAFTTMSVMYTPTGAFKDTWRFEHEVDAVLVDLDIIAACPYRYAASGILDSMAKKIEIQNGKQIMLPEENDLDLYTAYRISEYSYEMLEHYGIQAIKDLQQQKVTKAVEYITYINIAVTGIIANTTRSFNQSALAHMIYYGVRSFFNEEAKMSLHGEIVAVGLFAQLFYNQLSEQCDKLKTFMSHMNMPLSMEALGVNFTEEKRTLLEQYLLDSPYVEATLEGRERLQNAMKELQ